MLKLFPLIKNSVTLKNGKTSSTRIISYGITIIIYVFCFVFIGIEISSAIIALSTVGKYSISNEIIIVFGSLLAHQLTLLGITKSNETSQLKIEKEKQNSKTED